MVELADSVAPVSVRQLTERFGVTHDTVYRWFKRDGLEHAKAGGKVITTWPAVNRWLVQRGGTPPVNQPVALDRETAEAIKNLNARFGQGSRNGGPKKSAREA